MLRRVKNKIKKDGLGSFVRAAKINFFLKAERNILFKRSRLLPLCFSSPRRIYVELSSKCNLNCGTCFREEEKREQGIMNLDLVYHIIYEAAMLGGVSLHLGFAGEPLMHPDLFKILAYLKNFKGDFYKVSLTTNGTLLNRNNIHWILESHVVDWVTVSMDAVGKRFEELRVGANYEAVKKNLLLFLEERDLMNSKKFPIISINCVISSQTRKELGVLFHEWDGVVDNVNFSGCIDEKFRFLNMKKFKKINPLAAKKHLTPTCLFPFELMAILWDGSVTYCCHNLNGKFSFGNAYKTSLRDLWNDFEYKRARRCLAARKVPEDSVCSSCKKFSWM